MCYYRIVIFLFLICSNLFAQRISKVNYRDLSPAVKDIINSKGVFLSTYATFNAAVTAASSGYLILDDSVLTTTNKDLTGILVMFTDAGMLNVQSGDTITFGANSILADYNQKIFHDGGGEVRMAGSHIHAKWFGVVGDGATEDHTAIQWAADALRGEDNANITRGTWGTLEFPKGKFIVNPTNHLEFLPDSARTLHIVGQGDGTIFTNRDFAAYGDLFGDTYVAAGKPVQGEVRFAYFRIDSTHQGDSDGTGGVNAFGIVMSDAIIEHVKINRAGNRAIAFEGYDDGYTGTGNGFGNVTLRNLEITNSWKNAISINKHDSARIEYVNLEKIFIDGWSMAVVDSPGQAANTNATGLNLLARQTTGDNPGHTFSITDLIMKNGNATAVELNGLNSDNQFYGKNWTLTDINVDSATTPAAVLITEAWGGYIDGLTIRNTVGGPAWRDRTGNGSWHITNAIIDTTTTGQAVGYAFDLFGTSGYMISNSRILDNARGIFANNTSAVPWGWITNSHIRGDSLGYYTYEYNLEDVFSVTGTRIEYTRDAYTATGLNIAYNGYFAADSHNVKDFDSNGIPDGWEIYFPYNDVYRDSLITYLDADSGLVIENQASVQLDFILRQHVGTRLSGSDTYTLNMMTLDDNGGNTLRQWVNAGTVGGAITTGTYQQTVQTVTSYIGVGRTGATGMAANSRLVVKWIECLVE